MDSQIEALVLQAAEELRITDPDQIDILRGLAKCAAIEGQIYEHDELMEDLGATADARYQDLLTKRCCVRC